MDRFYKTQKALRDTARRFAQAEILPRAAAIDRDDRLPRFTRAWPTSACSASACTKARAAQGSTRSTASIAMEELARCSGRGGQRFRHSGRGGAVFDQHGTETHKALIPQILSGEIIPATAVSEPDHGSDVASIRTTAVRDGNGWLLDGTKAWVTLGGVADRIMVFARTGASPDTAPSPACSSMANCRVLRAARTKSFWACTAWRIARSPSPACACRPTV